MTLQDYYIIILDKFKNEEYKVIISEYASIPIPTIDIKNIHNEALNYMIYEYMEDYNDRRCDIIFDYFLKPIDVGNNTEIDFDFTSVSFEKFFEFMLSIKN